MTEVGNGHPETVGSSEKFDVLTGPCMSVLELRTRCGVVWTDAVEGNIRISATTLITSKMGA